MSWVSALAAIAEVSEICPLRPDAVRVDAGTQWELRVHTYRRAPRPSELASILRDGGEALLVAPKLTRSVREQLECAGWSWADNFGAALRTPAGTWLRTSDAWQQQAALRQRWRELDEKSSTPRGAPAELDLVRVLVTEPRPQWTQVQLAERLGITQPAVSQAFKRLRSKGLVTTNGSLANVSTAIDWWVGHYVLPTASIETHWYSLDDAWATTELLLAEAGPVDVHISGPVAADVLEPWLPPDRSVIYAPSGGWIPNSLTRVDDASDGVVTIVVVDVDAVAWRDVSDAHARSPRKTDVTLAHPLQVLWDLKRLPTDDPTRRDEASARLRARIERDAVGSNG